MTDATRADAVVDQLLDLLPAPLATLERPTGYTVKVQEGWPSDIIDTDTVVVGNHSTDQGPKNLGARHWSEEITIELEILVRLPDADATEVRHRVHGIADAIAGWARSTSGLTAGGSVCQCLFTVGEYFAGVKDQARSGWLRCKFIAKFDRLTA